MRLRFPALLAAALVAACSTSDPMGEERSFRSRVGSLVGLGGGEAVSRPERNAALVAAGVKPLAAAEVAAAMDRNEADLRAKLQGKGVTINRVGDQILLVIPADQLFDAQKDQIKRSFTPTLNALAADLKSYNQTLIDVYGHTDTNGAEDKNFELSQKRALAVASHLAGQGVSDKRFAVTGFGETRQAADNGTSEGRAKNRRVEIQLSPLT